MSSLKARSDKLYIEVHSSDGGMTALTINEAEQLQSELSSALTQAKLYAVGLQSPTERAERIQALMDIIDPKQELKDKA